VEGEDADSMGSDGVVGDAVRMQARKDDLLECGRWRGTSNEGRG
jgi:hypothetical protein